MRVLIFLTLVVVPTTLGFPERSETSCRVQQTCTKPYDIRRTASAGNLAKFCASLTLFQLCLEQHKPSCHSTIYYHTVKALIPVLMRDRKCHNITLPKNESELLKFFEVSTSPQPVDPKPTNKPRCEAAIRRNAYRNVNTASKRYCGLFGDPHLRTFYDLKQTCVVEGAWPLIDNQFIVVQVTNVPLVEGFDATATNKITVLVNEHKDSCVEQKIYQAKSNSLPAAFVDGTSVTGTSECKVEVIELKKDSLIGIRLCHVSTDILVRRVGQFLTFHIKMPQELATLESGQGLCISGCPHKEIIDYRELLSYSEAQLKVRLPKERISRREAKEHCESHKIKGFYLDSCIFDLLTTGDGNFTLAAKTALEDAFTMDPMGTLTDIQTYNVSSIRTKTTRVESGAGLCIHGNVRWMTVLMLLCVTSLSV